MSEALFGECQDFFLMTMADHHHGQPMVIWKILTRATMDFQIGECQVLAI